ncbi:MAG: dynamin family protein [Deltaproteobacteria bacterium]|nr:dynamin family protein [Deltaproteobacteria bacterium]MBW2068130.1 dynamin family protein [Deltaproteobacteria bacterium]
MNEYLHLKRQISTRIEVLRDIVDTLRRWDIVDEQTLGVWQGQLEAVRDVCEQSALRIAVVGPVKSGKSTLINALIGRDLLKRGAGIITSFVTRVINNEFPHARIEIKSFDEITSELKRAISMLPFPVERKSSWDLRSPSDRETIREIVGSAIRDKSGGSSPLNPNALLLLSLVEGFENVESYLREGQFILKFGPEELDGHHKFVSNESLAVYVKNTEIHCPIGWIEEPIELADCQGSDSPNPLHLARLQEYLLRSHFVVYVVSSRMGLREADFKLLDLLRALQVFPHTLFVLNVDVDVHTDLGDLRELERRVVDELKWMVESPVVYSFSALAELTRVLGMEADEKEARKLRLWDEVHSDIVRFSKEQFSDFKEHLRSKILQEKAYLLLSSGLGRLRMTASSVHDFAVTQKKLLHSNLEELKRMDLDMKRRRDALMTTLSSLENTVSGLRDTLREELDRAMHVFFNVSSGPVVREILGMIDSYRIAPSYEEKFSDPRRVAAALHAFYAEFRQAIVKFLTETVNLRILDFAKQQEGVLRDRFDQSARAFATLFMVALNDYRKTLEQVELSLQSFEAGDIAPWSPPSDVVPPSFSTFAEDQVLSRGVLLIKYGIGRIGRIFRRFIDKLSGRRRSWEIFVSRDNLDEAVELVKRELREELLYAVRDYRQNFKFQYLYRLIDDGIAHIIREFRVRAELIATDLEKLLDVAQSEGGIKQELLEDLEKAVQVCSAMADELEDLRCAMQIRSCSGNEANHQAGCLPEV